MDVLEKLMILRQCPLFQEVTPEALLAVAEEIESSEFTPGETSYKAGDPANAIYIVASGEVQIQRQQQPLIQLKKGGFFGIGALLEGVSVVTDATALSEGVVLTIDKVTFDKISDDLPEVLIALIKSMVRFFKNKIT